MPFCLSSTVKNGTHVSLKERLIKSPLMSCIAGACILWVSFGIRQSLGVFLIPITLDTGMDRSTFSVGAALMQLLWGFGQPFLVFLAERKFGFGKMIFGCSIVYAAGCFILYASNHSAGLYVFSVGVVIGLAAGGISFPIVLASIGRRFPQHSKRQSVAFGIVSSFGSFGQCCFLPMARGMLTIIGWRMAFVVLGIIMVVLSPFAYFLQTIPPTPALPNTATEKKDNKDEEINLDTAEDIMINEEDRPYEDISAPDIKTALKEAFTNPTFMLITVGFSVCGFHISFLSTHLPAYLQDNGINTSLASWTLSIIGLCSMFGATLAGYLASIFKPKYILMVIYTLRAILMIIVVFIPISVTTVVTFSVFFGVSCIFVIVVLIFVVYMVIHCSAFVGHQIGAFLGAYVAGVVYDQSHSYRRMWYGAIAIAAFAVALNFLASVEPMNERRIRLSNAALKK
ncbi:major facilitator superfamily domain-containing protein [Gilbertella persicaria]|uniref:major facilitator superfamily domain-containing protein n=1 Tax=Gilbertella persicaria TaxID=101096 RepID=UPI002220A64A|nr:major facilitator superfamily domain-containing protein [Gilbertella persicaria]KAI8079016.1 major facilitator superfamily domain-containing protein [Gilbertella persicaria]